MVRLGDDDTWSDNEDDDEGYKECERHKSLVCREDFVCNDKQRGSYEDYLSVTANGQECRNPWAGGIRCRRSDRNITYEIHYHPPSSMTNDISPYREEDADIPRTRSKWVWLLGTLCICFLLRHSSELSSSFRYTSLFAGQLVMEVKNLLEQDLRALFGWVWGQRQWRRMRSNCSLALPISLPKHVASRIDGNSSIIETWLRDGIVGQSRATTILSKFLLENQGWIENKDNHNDLRPTKVLVLAGPYGVGKLETSYLLHDMLTSHCVSEDRGEHDKGRHSILVLHGSDYTNLALSQINSDIKSQDIFQNAKDLLKDRIMNYQKTTKRKGYVIVVSGVEQMEAATVLDLIDILNNDNQDNTSKTLLILTTDLGTDQVFRFLRDGGDIVGISVEGSIRKILNAHWKERVAVDEVIPYSPLRHSDLVEILHRKVAAISRTHASSASWRRLVITESTLRYLVGTSFVDYLDLRQSFSSSESREQGVSAVFSKHGAHPLEYGGPMNIVREKVRYFIEHPFTRRDDQIKRSIAVFDYLPKQREGILKWCTDEEGKNSDGEVMADHRSYGYDNSFCEDIWKGPLQS